jgi:hypothetical protein
MRRVLLNELKRLNFYQDSNEQDLEEVVMETDSICYRQFAVSSNEEMMRYHLEIVSIDLMINRDIEVE